MPQFIWVTDLQNTSPGDVASLRFLACSGHNHRRAAAYGLHTESLWSGVARRERGPASSPQFPGLELRVPFYMVRAFLFV
jgi:hypothetical protein